MSDGAETRSMFARMGGIVSGGPLSADVTEAWAVHPFVGRRISRAHYWRRLGPFIDGIAGVESACGINAAITPRIPLLEPGAYAYCRRCELKLLNLR